jgi:hypothetical protein
LSRVGSFEASQWLLTGSPARQRDPVAASQDVAIADAFALEVRVVASHIGRLPIAACAWSLEASVQPSDAGERVERGAF